VSDSEDMRARLEARVAARRAEVAPAEAADTASAASVASAARGVRPQRSALHLALRLVIVLAAAAAFAFGLRAWVVQPFWIPSQSMEPTLHGCPGCDPDRLLVDKLSYHLHGVRRGDVVVFTRPPTLQSTDADLVKRVIGLPGESVQAVNGTVFVDGHALAEPYVAKACDGTSDFGPTKVPAGEVFVMGDNRCDSSDSRVFGPIATSTIIGRAFVIVWPLPRIHWL
jgi:signal peptidase I